MKVSGVKKETRMQSDIELLLKLQVIDYDLGELERSKEYLPDMMNNLKGEVQDIQKKIEETSAELEEAKITQKNLELEVNANETELQKYQKMMMNIKTNKEYDALVSQIDSVKSTISTKEQELLEVLERVETLTPELPEMKEKHKQLDDNNSRQLQILQEKVDSIDGTVVGKEQERMTILKEIPRRTMSVYERINRGKNGAVVVPVRRRSCSACNKALTPKKVQEIRRGDQINTCESCGRILYWNEDISN
ncbi:MAG: C4-type zinc ribbon domain-containing protein [candidate division Zixibacteria bacterium]|nr:C4-type zinc ribbon domain-containing protein [candidate division Zixibacteria bacterium]